MTAVPYTSEGCRFSGVDAELDLNGKGAAPVVIHFDTHCPATMGTTVTIGSKTMPRLEPGNLTTQEASLLSTTMPALEARAFALSQHG